MPEKPKIFVSYAHLDEPDAPGEFKWLTYVLSHLQQAVTHGAFTFWVDRHMSGGAKWEAAIETNLRACDIFVLLVSRFSMASKFIIEKEIAIARERLTRGDDLHFYPIVLTPVAKIAIVKVREFNLRPRDGKPLSSFGSHDRDQHMADIVNEIADIAEAIDSRRAATATPGTAGVPPAAGAGGTPAVPGAPSLINLTKLPETGYKTLVGRDPELALLDSVWADPHVHVFSLIAEGGAGKTALVNEWLTRMRRDNYRGAEVVLGWSFYSQGSKERATSADGFLDWAVRELGLDVSSTAATAKAEAIAGALAKRRALLILDGVEPLQHGPGPQAGQLKDQGLRVLLRRFAAEASSPGHGLIVLSSRAQIADLVRWKTSSAPVEEVTRLSDEAGAELLRDNGATGSDKDLRAAAQDFGGHPLALTLLASLVREAQGRDIRRRDHIRALTKDPENPGHDHAARVMESIDKEWLAAHPLLQAIMFVVGLFDRPASADCLEALRQPPVISGLTERLSTLMEVDWNRAVTQLRDARLLAPEDPATPGAIDAHPLAREWFGERLRKANETAWKAAHGRLYEHLRDTTKEGDEPTLDALAPLYQAIAHGSRADRCFETLNDVYVKRIVRTATNGRELFYATNVLGAVSSDLAAMSWFFESPYTVFASGLTFGQEMWVQAEASTHLAWIGRLREAAPIQRAVLTALERAREWDNASIQAAVISLTELTLGNIAEAELAAKHAVDLAKHARNNSLVRDFTGALANVRAARGRNREAETLFNDAESRTQLITPEYPLLGSRNGYFYCDLLLRKGSFAYVVKRATKTLSWSHFSRIALDRGLNALSLGRAYLGSALTAFKTKTYLENLRDSAEKIDAAVSFLSAAGQSDQIPLGYLARAAFRRSVADWPGAALDLDEVEEIAEPGPMKLFLCDMALERARLALWRHHGFAPLAGLLEGQPPKPAPDPSQALLDEARKQLAIAGDFITTCGYHKRDAELAELEAVLAGKQTPAKLPPRV